MEIQETNDCVMTDGIISLALNMGKHSPEKLNSVLSNPAKIDIIINDSGVAKVLDYETVKKMKELNPTGFEKSGLILFNVEVMLHKDKPSELGVMSGLLVPTDEADANYIVHWLNLSFKDNQGVDTVYAAAQCWSFIEHKYNKLIINANVKSALVERATMDSFQA